MRTRPRAEHPIEPNDGKDLQPMQTAQGEPISLRALLDICARYMSPADLDLLRDAYVVAAEAHGDALRKSGERFIEHPLAVARILAELALDAPGIAAALLHDTVEDTTLTLDDVSSRFGAEIAEIVDGVTKFTTSETSEPAGEGKGHLYGQNGAAGQNGHLAHPDEEAHAREMSAALTRERKARQQVETVRKLFLALVSDPRVVLVKLADRLHNMRTLGSMAPAQREQKARETLDIYAPLATRIGLYTFKSELEDLAFATLYALDCERIMGRLHDEEMKRSAWAERFCERIRRELAANNLTAAVNWRVKHPYRAYLESEESGIDVALLHDLIAFRVLVTTPEECYQALGIIHHLWHPYRERFTDYIASPKINGYQSLHTAVFALDGRLAQMHIRTHAMHRATQHGVANYWLELALAGEEPEPGSQHWLAQMPSWVARLAHWHDELKLSAAEFVDTLRGEMFEDQVFVFTPKGEVRELPAGSTVLDFAYQIHTRVGDAAINALVRLDSMHDSLLQRTVPLSYVLKTGDIVQVVTASEPRPQAAWLDMVYTRYAREKIMRALARQRRIGSVEVQQSFEYEPTAESEPEDATPLLHPSGRVAVVRLAHCCYPCPGDAIIGLAQRDGRTVAIHRTCCRTLRVALARRSAQAGQRVEGLPVRWEEIQPITYRLHLSISGQDHQGLVHEVSSCVAEMGLNVAGTAAVANQDRHKAAILLTLDILPGVRRELVLRRLRAVPGVIQVERDGRKGCE